MSTITIEIDSPQKMKLIKALAKEMGAKIIVNRSKRASDFNAETLAAIKEAREGKTIKCSNYDDYLKKVQ